MIRLLLVSALAFWVGATLLLSELRWFSRAPLVERLRPYAPGGLAPATRPGVLSVASFREVVGPLARSLGERVARLFGVSEDLAVRLARIHSPLDVTGFRVRQLGAAVGAFGAAVLLALAMGTGVSGTLLLVFGAPLLAFLMLEQRLARASGDWQRRVTLELPVVAEQLAMLLSAGYSLGAAINRVAARGQGRCARDLRDVGVRMRQGLSEVDALREWAARARVGALDRLVPVLALNRDAPDLGRLLSAEARAIRQDVQRDLVQVMERRAQQVWVPVTVATLVPGVIFLAIPFIEALRLFSGS